MSPKDLTPFQVVRSMRIPDISSSRYLVDRWSMRGWASLSLPEQYSMGLPAQPIRRIISALHRLRHLDGLRLAQVFSDPESSSSWFMRADKPRPKISVRIW